jgi:hypothetical protein
MVNYCLALPILPSGLELLKKFVQENGGHTRDHDEFYKSAGISREHLWVQHSPPGTGAPDLAIVSIETDNPAKTLKEFATSNHSWAIKFREFAKKTYGIEFAGPPPPLNESIVDWQQIIELDNGARISTRTIVIPTGAQYRKLPLENLSRFEGAGVYYGATFVEAQLCGGEDT